MSVEEWWWLYDVKRKRNPDTDYAGGLDDESVSELYAMLGN